MPHVIIEHSANVDHIADIVAAVHSAALGTGVAAVDALRTRAARRDDYAIADRDPDNAFIAVYARLGPGRTDDEKRCLIEAIIDAVDDTVGDARQHMMLSVEYQEIDPTFRINRNHLRDSATSGSDPAVAP